jgi:5-(carboxyamino)imidazole ribonucleotide mutase
MTRSLVGRRRFLAEVTIVLGSPSDREWAQRIVDALQRLEIECDTRIASAHKTPTHLLEILNHSEESSDPHVIITVAGRSNALSGFVDAAVSCPVIACPPSSDAFGGMDVLSSLRMPSGVAPLVVLDPHNAALAAAKILGLGNPCLRERIRHAQQADRERVIEADHDSRRRTDEMTTGDRP